MPQTPLYFRPRNWSKFQSRSNNSMAWVKNYTALLHDHTYLSLTPVQRYVLHGIWMLCGSVGRPLARDCGFIGRALAMHCPTVGKALDALELNNFIELCDPTQNLHEKLPHLEESREDKKERKKPPPTKVGSPPLPKPVEKSNGSKQPVRQGARLPEDWAPSESEISYAAKRGFNETHIRDIAEDFRTYWTAGAGRNKTHADWTRAWQTWIRRERPSNNRSTEHPASGDRLGHGSLAAAVRRNLV